MATSESTIRELLDLAEIQINGSQPWDLQVHDNRLYERVLRDSSLGLGEAYMDGLVGLRIDRWVHLPGA